MSEPIHGASASGPGSREPSQQETVSAASGFDPSRDRWAFIKTDFPDCPGKIGVAIVQKTERASAEGAAELIDFRLCESMAEANGYMALFGISGAPVWTRTEGHRP